jgi:hypothetical protein
MPFDSYSEQRPVTIKNLLSFKFDDPLGTKISSKNIPQTTRANGSSDKSNIKKDLEILNLTSINQQLLKAQESKSEIIKQYYIENNLLKKEISNIRLEMEAMRNHITKLKFKIKHYKVALKDSGMSNNILDKMESLMDNSEEKIVKKKSKENFINPSKITGIPVPSINALREGNFFQNTNGLSQEISSLNGSQSPNKLNTGKRNSTIEVLNNIPGFFKSNLKTVSTIDHYKRLTLNYIRKL